MRLRPSVMLLSATSAGLSLGLALFSFVPVSAASSSKIDNGFYVQARILSQSIHFKARYTISPVAGCPVSEPSDPLSPAWDRWSSNYCSDYVFQRADLVLKVFHGGRVVWSEDGQGLGDFTAKYPSLRGGSWDTYMYAFDLGLCRAGTYRWHVSLLDPYNRQTKGANGYFTRSCG